MAEKNEKLQQLRDEVRLIEMKRELARLEAEEKASILGNSYAGKLKIGAEVPKRPIMKPYKPEEPRPTAYQYLKTKGKRIEEGMTFGMFKQQRKINIPTAVSYPTKGKQHTFILPKHENREVTLKPEYLEMSQLTDFQKQLLSRLSPKHTGEIKAEIEKEFKRLNKTAPISKSIDAVEVKAETQLSVYDAAVKVNWEFF